MPSKRSSTALPRERPTSTLLPFETVQRLAEGAAVLPTYALGIADALASQVRELLRQAPLRHMVTPGGQHMSVAMSNCGSAGWISDRRGYRYETRDPQSGLPWPQMPPSLRRLAQDAAACAGYADFDPDACLINSYAPGTRLTLHQDRDERDLSAPVVSVSLGLPAVFLYGGLQRRDRVRRVPLFHGDVVVWGGAQRLVFHGVAPLADGEHPATGRSRLNLTFRRAF
ncbi:MAG TPA: DNA oxidative demethylase AlkB [Steroidobacteraceae bacterium]|nr:DNA oxidative demethylase AlkB [Steroidobacteraceae bacterium]